MDRFSGARVSGLVNGVLRKLARCRLGLGERARALELYDSALSRLGPALAVLRQGPNPADRARLAFAEKAYQDLQADRALAASGRAPAR